ncbi:hydrogen peroxide-inducible genes activator [Draconibacterium sp. IB214405]|uniref:hydrogen peroxide-inducible genes activator n=1 Tax=Draconibacterium sp. IB214405 TaxID=3097352 RepID=UPI002A164EA8|nr:hydrogen peroxide-inducible genes activator [Draconibacterium sp. IB214405]MDX8340344.1 hydrogen peroxide-inducible genes activator [Draconibacterium sp. IB214405]
MTLQQLEYILAVNKYRHFVTASKQCGVTQPTLSTMIQKLEAELEVDIFDRSKHPIQPTALGEKIIEQAERSLKEIWKIGELVWNETDSLTGKLHMGVIPTLANYLVPRFIKTFGENCASVQLSISEMNTATLIRMLKKDKVDMFIAATPLGEPDFLEIPLFYERFYAYFAADHPLKDVPLNPSNMPQEKLWVLEEGHCLRDQVFNFCTTKMPYNQVFEAGSIDTLVRIVDLNGGYTLIPELHLPMLSEEQRKNVREINDPPAIREVSIVIHKNFVKERILNEVGEAFKTIIPDEMIDERLKKFAIRL